MRQGADGSRANEKPTAAHTVRLPKFLVQETVGLGQMVKRLAALLDSTFFRAQLRSASACSSRCVSAWLREWNQSSQTLS